MNRRFQIEDLIEQDASGVVFRALDAEAGRTVAVRRFFPFGADGGGLEGEEREAYRAAVARLSEISHPALRAVVAGGCDPVDGLPFVVTEWVEGEPLAEIVARHGPLSPGAAADLLARAIEVSGLLSRVLGSEAVWVETCPLTIVKDEGGRGFTFWICPRRWLGASAESRTPASLATLAADALGWSGRVVADHAGGGIGGWMKWLRSHSATLTLAEARDVLEKLPARHAATDEPAAPPPAAEPAAPTPAQPATPKPVQLKPPSTRGPLVAALIVAVAVLAAGGWLWMNRKNANPPPAIALAEAGGRTVPPAAAVAEEVQPEEPERVAAVPAAGGGDKARVEDMARRQLEELERSEAEKEAIEAELRGQIARRNGVFSPEDRELLMLLDDQLVAIEGKVSNVRETKATIYFEFIGSGPNNEPRGYLPKKFAGLVLEGRRPEDFTGSMVRLEGRLDVFRDETPQVVMERPNAIRRIGD